MTCREKLAQEHPEFVSSMNIGGCKSCPQAYGYLPKPYYCGDSKNGKEAIETCTKCWDREIPETPKWPKENPHIPDSIKNAMKRLGEDAKVGVLAIKDSGDRTEFETGAVRDMREGKGRCDLMPLEVVAWMLGGDNPDSIVYSISRFMKNRKTEFLYDALNTFTAAYHNQMETMFLEVAKHFEEGAKKYGENNWQKGIPVHCYIDSAVRHYLKWLRGDNDEPHDRAFVWNIMCCIWEVDYREKEGTE